MEANKRKIKVLWIDDNPDQFEEFLDDAFDAGLDIDVYKTVDSGLTALQNRNIIYEAIILDANCKISDENAEAPALVALSHAIVGIYAIGSSIPWFVYTGGGYEGAEALEYIIPQKYRSWDERHWYDKPDDEDELFKAIISAVENSETHNLMLQFPEAFEISKSQELLDLLKRRDSHEFERDETVPNSLRCVADDVCHFLRDKGIYPAEFVTSNKIQECSKVIGVDYKNEIAPRYIQNCFRFLSDYCNAASHQSEKREQSRTQNTIRDDIRSGKAKYLNRSAVHSLMNIILWASNFPVNDIEAMKQWKEKMLKLKADLEKRLLRREERKRKDLNND